jgi:CPA1 family monovalent cation:H+ antiporter
MSLPMFPWAASSSGLDFLNLSAILITFTAVCAYINHRFLRLPPSIGVMAVALAFSLCFVFAGMFSPTVERGARDFIAQIDFNKTVLNGMLGFLLFAGALHVDLGDLASRRWLIGLLASVGVVTTTLIVGFASHAVLAALGIEARLMYCLMFGALIAPTDPIAVLAMLKEARAPKQLEVTIAGESLFNDGVGVVVFLGFLQAAQAGQEVTLQGLGASFLQEAVGGAAFGFALGLLFFYLFRSVDKYAVEILLSLALVAGGYALATYLHISAPITMVIAGLLIGNHGRAYAMSETTREHLDTFWELIDEILNAVLFVLLGVEVLALTFTGKFLLAGACFIPIVLAARLVSVTIPVLLLRMGTSVDKYTTRLLCWGGLRGGLSVAMALAVPEAAPEREWMLTATYVVVAFSVLVQGTTIGPLMRRWLRPGAQEVPA